jgi:hypothetical protein
LQRVWLNFQVTTEDSSQCAASYDESVAMLLKPEASRPRALVVVKKSLELWSL